MSLRAIVRRSVYALLVGGLASTAFAIDPQASRDVSDFAKQAHERHAQLGRASLQSNDLRLRILFSRVYVVGLQAAKTAELKDLIDHARGSTDPLVLELLLDRCRLLQPSAGPSTCDATDLATRWTQADGENAMSWVELATVLEQAGDIDGADNAWQRAGRASTFRDPQHATILALLNGIPVAGDPRARYFDMLFAFGHAAAVPVLYYTDAKRGCKLEARRAICAAIADTAFRDADTMFSLMAARQLTAEAQAPAWLHASRQQTEEALEWAMSQENADAGLDTIDVADEKQMTKIVATLDERVTRGELVVARDTLRELRVSDAEGSKRYAANMAALMKRLHPD